MRWFWIDRFEKFIATQEAVAVKNVTLSDEPLDGYLPGLPHYPHTLIIEGMAQTGGILLSQIDEFRSKVVLAKVGKAEFQRPAYPGDQLRLTATLVNRQPDGGIVEGRVEVNGEHQADLNLTFAILDDSFGKESFFLPADFCRVLRSLRLFDVGIYPDGSPIAIPDHMLEAEREAIQALERAVLPS
ncbi:MAG: beta-hydroxyacyl-ACP dehydratase [Pirellulaceae bacterium]|nr:MAG: beta-hydroxyacyl-ACP dehydratase [Pirellulaceae bacterium]